jgi:hypothetical protein
MFLGFLGFLRWQRPTLRPSAAALFAVLLLGLSLMVLGNVAEFWVFTDVPYSGGRGFNIRDAAWTTFLLGSLLAIIGSTAFGLLSLVKEGPLRWLAIAFALEMPATVVFSAISFSFASIPLGVLSIVACVPQFLHKTRAAESPVQA